MPPSARVTAGPGAVSAPYGGLARAGALVRSLRPRQWVKNGFVIAPALFGQKLGDAAVVSDVAAAVVCFCVASSAVYLVNDVLDRDEDRIHPDKRWRPIAAGLVPVPVALGLAGALFTMALVGALALDWLFALVLGAYAVESLVYTAYLKHEVILDVMGIAAGFVLRVVAGAALIRLEPSVWILICTGLLALLLAFGKRRAEVVSLGEDSIRHRRVLGDYNVPFLDTMLQLTAGATLASYAIYTATGKPAEDHLAATLPLVLYGVLRYLWLVMYRQLGGSPTALVWSDRPLQVTIALWVALSATLLAV